MNKICTKCGVCKPLTDYHKRPETKDGRRTDCKACCQKLKADRWAAMPKEERKKRNRKNKLSFYGLTLEAYAEKVDAQDNKCYLCGTPGKEDKLLYVDHCHSSGKVRKLLCLLCNSGLGYFKDNPELLRKAADYVEEHNDN